eukprot:TRINITY_DN1194_c0_g1_i3.p1 TRINITY_DN1194_c0_g1~~TRINITY_DN1194_c0_g1_i3.p1  ORF type:complete len:1048 (-),score=156.93 TRINITY_DN1194_c0_g1_i3:104-3247(-)
MEPIIAENIDLIDDIWRRIFTSLDCCFRAELFQVCKRWQSVLASPLCWLELDVKLTADADSEARSTTTSLSRFISKYCSLASKINIELKNSVQWEVLFEALFPLVRLRYLRFIMGPTSWSKQIFKALKTYKVPSWTNMVYLNIGGTNAVTIDPFLLARVFEGTPNLEELYLHRHISVLAEGFSLSIFQPLRKLKYLSLTEDFVKPSIRLLGGTQEPIQTQEIIAQVPQLEIVLVFQSSGTDRPRRVLDGRTAPNAESNTLMLYSRALWSRELGVVKKIGPLLKRSNYAYYFVPPSLPNPNQPINLETQNLAQEFDSQLLDYLFNELKLDINCNTDDTSNPFVADLFRMTFSRKMYLSPLASVISNVNEVRKMLDLGADPNLAYENKSPFALSQITKESCLLLLERGADPLKKVNGKAALACLFVSKMTDEGVAEVIQVVLKKGVDPNFIMEGEITLLDLAIKHQYRETALALLDHGARWTANAMDLLITWNKQWWQEVIESGAFDTNKLHLSTALLAIKHEMYSLVRDFLLSYTRELDANGYSLVHYISVLPLLKTVAHPTVRRKATARPNAAVRTAVGSGSTPSLDPLASLMRTNKAIPGKIADVNTLNNNQAPHDTAKVAGSGPRRAPESTQKQLIEELSLDVNLKSTKGKTPLLLVCEHPNANTEAVTTLIDSGANVNEADSNGWTPLHAALYLHKYETAKELLSHGANINAQDKLGITPAMAFVLCIKGVTPPSTSMWTHLLSCAFDVTITDKYMSRSILHHLVTDTGRVPFLLELMESSLRHDVNCRDAHGFTPLHYAAMLDQLEAMECLINHGADTNAVSYTLKLTPLAVMLALRRSESLYNRYVKTYTTLQTIPITASSTIGIPGNKLEIISTKIPPWCSDNYSPANKTIFGRSSDSKYFPLPSDLSTTDQFGNNSLHYVVHAGVVSMLFQNIFPAELHQYWSVPNKFRTTPLHVFLMNAPASGGGYGGFGSTDYSMSDTLLEMMLTQHQQHVLYGLNNKDEHGKTGVEYLVQNPALLQHVEPLLLTFENIISSSVSDIE